MAGTAFAAGLLFMGLVIAYTKEPVVRITYKDYGNSTSVRPSEAGGTVICNSVGRRFLSVQRKYHVLPDDVPQLDVGNALFGTQTDAERAQYETAVAARRAADDACAGPVHRMDSLFDWSLVALLVTGAALLVMSLVGIGRVLRSRRTS